MDKTLQILEDKEGHISFTRNYASPFRGIFALSVSDWRMTQWLLPDRDACNASCQIWPFQVISVKVISVIIGSFLKNLLWSFTWHHVNNSTNSQGLSAFFTGTFDYDWLHDTIDSIYLVRHVKTIIIPYQWLKVEQKNACLLWESVENSDAARLRTDF